MGYSVERVVRRMVFVWMFVAFAMPARAQVREGAALFTPPPGWTRVSDAEGTRYVSPDKTASIAVGRAIAYTGTLATPLDTLISTAKQLPQYREESRQPGGAHDRAGGAWTAVLYTYAGPTPNTFVYVWVVLVGAGGRAVPFTGTFATHNDFKTHGPAVLKASNEASLTTTAILERGTPPLTRYAVDETTDFIEWLMETPLTVGQRSTLETELRTYWQTNRKDEIDGIVELLGVRDQLAAMKPAEREVARQAVLDPVMKEWRRDKKSAAAKMLVGIYDAAHKPIAKGTPPLTRQSVDAFAEFLYFAATQAAGAPEVTPPAEIKAQLAKLVTKGYAKMPKDQRELIAEMPLVWAALRASWADLPAQDRDQYVAAWKATPALVQLGTALDPSKAPAATATATASRSGSAGGSAAKSQEDYMRNQMALQAQQQHFQMMQQMMQSNADHMRIMSSNLGGNTSYSYRW